ncbi:MAG: RNA 2',3'-cyclic phosphodiesterase [Firmicutes bacterium]|nr:RNA 2',3'-cyclic phosphodiesterase [Bacillota bacterium]
MRLFIAINFQDSIKAELAKLRDKLKKSAIKGRFSENENLHLTLVFLGECDTKQTETIKTAMNDAEFSPLFLGFDEVDFFKRLGGDIYFVRLKENWQLLKLQAELSNSLVKEGFILEKRKYTPHVTLGREIKMPESFIAPKIEAIEFSVQSIELMKSEHINGKLVYTPVYSKSATNI